MRTAWLLLLTLTGCTASDRCSDHTLFVTVELRSAVSTADSLLLTVAIDGQAGKSTTLGGLASGHGSIEIRFPGGYPSGKWVSVTLVASKGSVVLGSQSISVELAHSCEAASLVLSPLADLSPEDLAGSPTDLAGSPTDLAGSPTDLAGSPTDLATRAMADLAATDLFRSDGCAPSPESCFNGTDDDCDGLIDCADPDCGSIGTCVPAAPPAFVHGAIYAAGTVCPAPGSIGRPLYKDFANGGSTCAGCGCTASGSCVAELFSDAMSCPPSAPSTSFVADVFGTCQNVTLQSTFTFTEYFWGGSCVNSGTPSLPQGTMTSATFCSSPLVGAGCGANQVCTPVVSNHCVLADSPSSCPAGYQASSATWSTDFTDGRSCGSCSACDLISQGTCSDAATPPTMYTGADCTGTAVQVALGSECDGGFQSAKIVHDTALPVCATPTSNLLGNLSGAGTMEIVCCQ